MELFVEQLWPRRWSLYDIILFRPNDRDLRSAWHCVHHQSNHPVQWAPSRCRPRFIERWTDVHLSLTRTNTNPTFIFASYPTAAPCSINPEDCELLWKSWTTHYSAMTSRQDGLLDPPCSTREVSQSYSTNAAGGVCDNCLIIGHKIRLLYWPVLTKFGSGDLCNKTAETITASPTGDGPNQSITEGLTITRPSVDISVGGFSCVDKCGTAVAHTIIPVAPKDALSVNGARALFTHKPFNFADLNYECLSEPDAIYAITRADQNDCYQEVPASAYFGYANAAGVDWYMPKAFANSTIWPNCQPQVLPPKMMTEAIRSLWGDDCYIHPDGTWDPPVALGQVGSIPLPEDGPGAPT